MAKGAWMELFASDGHRFDTYVRGPGDRPRAGLVIIQEIFGVNEHIQDVCEGFAADGYLCVAPQMFDRVEKKVDLGYDADGIAKGRALKAEASTEAALLDLKAAMDVAQSAGKVATIGYCWGGFLSMAAAQHLPLAGAVVYYGGGIPSLGADPVQCPILAHFGEQDQGIPLDEVAAIRETHPSVEVHTYPAGHGFNCDRRASYEATCAKIARERTLDFLDRVCSG